MSRTQLENSKKGVALDHMSCLKLVVSCTACLSSLGANSDGCLFLLEDAGGLRPPGGPENRITDTLKAGS